VSLAYLGKQVISWPQFSLALQAKSLSFLTVSTNIILLHQDKVTPTNLI